MGRKKRKALIEVDEYAEWDLTGIVDEGRFPIYVQDKIAECEFFLDLMSKTTDWNHFRWLTSALLEAARASVDWIAHRAYHVDQWDEYQSTAPDPFYVKALSKFVKPRLNEKGKLIGLEPKGRLFKELWKHRKQTAHLGSLWIKPEKVTSPSEFMFGEVAVHKGRLLQKKDGKSVLQFAREVLDHIESISREVHESPWGS